MPLRDTRATVVLVRGGVELVSWPLRREASPDLALVDELARLQLTAIRMGYGLQLRDVCPALRDLLDLVGLGGMLEERGAEPDPAA